MTEQNNDAGWEPIGTRWGLANGISYNVNREPVIFDLASFPIKEPEADQTEPFRIEPTTSQPPAASPPPLPPTI